MLIHGDCKDILPTLKTKVDLIYLDPPFNTGRDFVEFDDRFKNGYIDTKFKWIIDNHSNDMAIYITFLYERLILAYDLLKDTGSIYLHCDPTASHYIKVMMDGVFGHKNFRNEVLWCYTQGGRPKNHWPNKHDILLFYSKTNKWFFDDTKVKIPYELILSKSSDSFTKQDEDGRWYKEIYGSGENKTKKYRYYKDEGKLPYDWWIDIPQITGRASVSKASQKLGYPTQKPIALLERIIKASSKEGDTVLDLFCGSGTTLVAAKNLNRNYIGIDINKNAIDLCNKRLSVDNLQ